jgi:hypothetical protein
MALTIDEYLTRGFSSSKEIQAATGLSQASVARKIREMGDSIIQVKEGRRIQYAATCNAFGGNDKLPLGAIDKNGDISIVAHLRPLKHGGIFVEPQNTYSLLLSGESKKGLYDDLPYFLNDARPQGFIGRQIARQIAAQDDNFPPDPKHWNNDHIGRYLTSNGDDLPGNLIFGEQALLRVRSAPVPVSIREYPKFADRIMQGDVPGSSAGGEQPKFALYNGDLEAHVIVKFASKDDNVIAQRSNDILITEYHAVNVLKNNGFLGADTRLIDMNQMRFLEMQRFDRHGTFGRSSMVSLQAIDAEFAGFGNHWPKVMRELHALKLINEADTLTAEALWHFGKLINNTDMHLGNLSLSMEGDSFRLLPVYDMCSMGFAPKSGGVLQPFDFERSDIESRYLTDHEMTMIKEMAHDFWENVTNDQRISEQFRVFLERGNPVAHLLSTGSSLTPN